MSYTPVMLGIITVRIYTPTSAISWFGRTKRKMADPIIVQVIHLYHPDWDAPADTGRDWIPCLCPFHPDSRRSAGISYRRNAFGCLGCGVKGDAYTIVRKQGRTTHAFAQRVVEGICLASGADVPPSPGRQPRRRVFSDTGIGGA